MRKTIKVVLEIDFTQWALPLEVWWVKGVFCIELLWFSAEFIDELRFRSHETDIQVPIQV